MTFANTSKITMSDNIWLTYNLQKAGAGGGVGSVTKMKMALSYSLLEHFVLTYL